MRQLPEIYSLIAELDHHPAAALEDQDLDFKEWSADTQHSISLMIEMAICMANGGGGTVVFGVNDKAVGRSKAISGVPPEIDVNRLKKAVYDATDPKLTPVFQEISVPEGTGRIIVMQVYSGLPPYTDTSGRGKIRIGKDCQPLTGTLRRRVLVETGETDFTATFVESSENDRLESLISPSAMENLREVARRENAPDDLLRQSDRDLLASIGLIKNGKLLRAGLLLCGTTAAIRETFPGYVWTHLRMTTDTDYSDRADGHEALSLALVRILDRVMANNPITTIPQGLYHFEIRTYPEVALREALVNAFVHTDYRMHGPILLKQFQDRIEISNPGGLSGGITPLNILRHEPVPRNPTLVEALTRLRLVNRSNLGIRRMYQALLIEGKEPPVIFDEGEAVRVIFRASDLSVPFRLFVASEGDKGRILTVEQLLVLQYLLRHSEIDPSDAARITQQTESDAKETLVEMERKLGYVDRAGTGKETCWTMRAEILHKISQPDLSDVGRRIEWTSTKARVLNLLVERARLGHSGLSNKEIRMMTHLTRHQVVRMVQELRNENDRIRLVGHGAGARYVWGEGPQ